MFTTKPLEIIRNQQDMDTVKALKPTLYILNPEQLSYKKCAEWKFTCWNS